MPCPHNEITIVQRSQRQSAVAAAAYQSGEKLFCEYDQQVKHYPEKRGIVHNEILLPANAPQEYTDRNTLSHTGIYLGNGMMVSAGDPIKYANIHSSYWEKHLAGFGRLSK